MFASDVKNATEIAEAFRARGIDAPLVHGELPATERDAAISRFASGVARVIVNVNVLTEGWDAPVCDVAMLARKIGSFPLLVQMIGRARRPFPGKRRALLIDLCGNLATHNFHPDDEIDYSLEGDGMSPGGCGAGDGPRVCRKCKRVLDDDIAQAAARGVELLKCPECGARLSKIRIYRVEEIELIRKVREEQREATPTDGRIRALQGLYLKGMREGRKRASAEFAFRSMFPPHVFPPAEIRIPARKAARAKHDEETGKPILPP